MAKKKVFILGAGLAGLSTAWHLQKTGIECKIFEKESQVGGLCRSKRIYEIAQADSGESAGFIFDYSGHLLHFKNNYALRLIQTLLGSNLLRHKRKAWVYSQAEFIHYPFQSNLYGLPKAIVKDCLLDFIKLHHNGGFRNLNTCSFRDWIIKTFGRGIAQNFMIPYNLKFWTVPLDELTCDWVDRFIIIPTLNQIIGGAIKESRQNLGYNAFFWYPKKGGIDELARAFQAGIKNIHLDNSVDRINLKKREITLNNGHKEKFDFLVSTVALPEMLNLIVDIPGGIRGQLKKLRWISIFNLNLGIKNGFSNTRHWIYFPEKKFSFFRVGFPHNFSTDLAAGVRSSLYAEVSYSVRKSIDKGKMIFRIKQDLKTAGILSNTEEICAEDVNDIKYGYPIYDRNYRESRQCVIEFLTRNNIMPCGRYGSWRYMSMEDVILDGKAVAGYISEHA